MRESLSAAATFELDSREKHHPAMIADGELTREEADADLAAWRVIAALFRGEEVESWLSWAELEHATSRALIRRSAKAEAKPDNRLLAARRDAVWGIHERIAWRRHLGRPVPSQEREAA